MKERPILFTGEMVRKVLSGEKTQTRRVIKPDWWRCLDPDDPDDRTKALGMCPYGKPGDRLWVRETWAMDDMLVEPNQDNICYRADGAVHAFAVVNGRNLLCGESFKHTAPRPERWRPSIHMPRWAARITLEVTGVRVELAQDISEADAKAEGTTTNEIETHREAFELLWDSINGKRPGCSWKDNPWTWVIEFKCLDDMEMH